METSTPPLAAITTVFSPPCPTTWLLTTNQPPPDFPQFPTTGPTSCDPPLWRAYLDSKGLAYYSPAICPSGFSAGCRISDPQVNRGFAPIQSDETMAYCVPFGHICTSDIGDILHGVWGLARTATAAGSFVTVGPAIQIRWRSKDLSILETDPLTTTNLDDTTNVQIPKTGSTPSASTSSDITLVTTMTPISTSGLSSSVSPNSELTTPATFLSSTTSIPSRPIEPATSSTSPLGNGTQDGGGSDAPKENTNSGDNGHTPSVTSFAVLAIVLTTILISILVLQQYRKYRAGGKPMRVVFKSKTWLAWQRAPKEDRCCDCMKPGSLPDAELGTDRPLAELSAAEAIGTTDNPAELGAVERHSWMTGVSKIMFSIGLRSNSADSKTS
ncbi:hypothetical protein F5Y19DRAFT_492093 [Xylariaceae sp. FL1651]|nr:hypothetical protein F5Y19DRAFT_492093 [Xylariaceae sp. FL1651]